MIVYLRPDRIRDPYTGLVDALDWSNPTRIEAPAAFALQATSSDTSDGVGQSISDGWRLFIPEGEQEPLPTDRVEFDGEVFVQSGRAHRERNPFTGWEPYAQVNLVRLEGEPA